MRVVEPACPIVRSHRSTSWLRLGQRALITGVSYFAMYEKVHREFEQEGLAIPFPQLDVHLHKPE